MQDAQVDVDTKEAVVRYDPEQVTIEQMREAVEKVGFRAGPRDDGREPAPWRDSP
jgi:copper chaperone CopZ